VREKITYILDKEEHEQTYAELFVEAKKILAGLKQKGNQSWR